MVNPTASDSFKCQFFMKKHLSDLYMKLFFDDEGMRFLEIQHFGINSCIKC